WINNCVGHRNHALFVRFLVSAVIGCIHALVILTAAFYHAIHFNYYYRYGDGSEPMILLTFWSLIAMVIASAFAFGVVVGVGGLLYLQLKYIKNNKTGIEEYIEQKAVSYRKEEDCDWEDFIYPYDLGWKQQQAMVSGGLYEKNVTTRTTATKEALKRYLSRIVVVEKSFRGGVFGSMCLGCRMFICQPISEEPRLKISVNEEYVVTRGQRGWLYGYKVDDEKLKGWFPRVCIRFTDKYPFQMEAKQSNDSTTSSSSTS
ncbi:hypothetical protein OSTOST_12769, partial [Ostertagia ostertagi]